MSVALAEPFTIIPNRILKDKNLTPRKKLILFNFLSFYSDKKPFPFAATGTLAETLDCSQRSVERDLAELEHDGFIKALAKKYLGNFTQFKLLFLEQDTSEAHSEPDIMPFVDRVDTHVVPPDTRDEQLKKEQINTKNNNTAVSEKIAVESPKQELVVVAEIKTEIPTPKPTEMSDVLKKLLAKKFSIKAAEKLIAKYGEEQCLKQIQLMEDSLKRGQIIRNQIAWLYDAIREDYLLPEKATNVEPTKEQKQISELLYKAKNNIRIGDLNKAIECAQSAIALGARDEGQTLIAQAIEKREQRENAVKRFEASLAPEKLAGIRAQAEKDAKKHPGFWDSLQDGIERMTRALIMQEMKAGC